MLPWHFAGCLYSNQGRHSPAHPDEIQFLFCSFSLQELQCNKWQSSAKQQAVSVVARACTLDNNCKFTLPTIGKIPDVANPCVSCSISLQQCAAMCNRCSTSSDNSLQNSSCQGRHATWDVVDLFYQNWQNCRVKSMLFGSFHCSSFCLLSQWSTKNVLFTLQMYFSETTPFCWEHPANHMPSIWQYTVVQQTFADVWQRLSSHSLLKGT